MKDPRPEDIKELTINGVLYAKYEPSGDILFLKMIENIIPDHARESEDCVIALIGLLERKEFTSCAYLNVK